MWNPWDAISAFCWSTCCLLISALPLLVAHFISVMAWLLGVAVQCCVHLCAGCLGEQNQPLDCDCVNTEWDFNSRNLSLLPLFRGGGVFLRSDLDGIPSLAGLQAGESDLPGALLRHLKKRLCYPSACLSTVLWDPGEQELCLQVQPEIFDYFSVLWLEGLSTEVRNWIGDLNVTCLLFQQFKYCKEKVLRFTPINHFSQHFSLSTSCFYIHCFVPPPGTSGVLSWRPSYWKLKW